MSDCWEMNAKDRPTFDSLKLRLEELHTESQGVCGGIEG